MRGSGGAGIWRSSTGFVNSTMGPLISYCDFARLRPGFILIPFFLENPAVQVKVAPRHDLCGEFLCDPLAHAFRIELHGPNLLSHLHDGIAHGAGNSLANHFGHSAAGKGVDRRSTRHGFDHDEAEWLFPLDREQKPHGSAEQFVFHGEVRFADVFDESVIDVRLDLGFKIVTKDRLNFAGNFERDPSLFCHLNGLMYAFQRRDAAKEAEIVFLVGLKAVLIQIDTVVDGFYIESWIV